METWEFDVGTSDQIPPIPDQYISRVKVLANSYFDAVHMAVGIVMRPGVEMVTSTTFLG